VYLLVFHIYINEMHGSRSKTSSKINILVRQHCAEGFNSAIKGLSSHCVSNPMINDSFVSKDKFLYCNYIFVSFAAVCMVPWLSILAAVTSLLKNHFESCVLTIVFPVKASTF
jgi:hypothetical protein